MRYYSPTTGCTYLDGIHIRPADARPISEERFLEVIARPAPGKVRAHDDNGLPILIDPSRGQLEAAAWERIKAERDRRTLSGFMVGTYWFHSDTFSRSQHLGLKDQARDVLAAGGAVSDVLIANGQPVQWKTLHGEFVPITVQLAFDIVQSATDSDARIFQAAEGHKAAMRTSADPATYDYRQGWPLTYDEWAAQQEA